MAVNPITSDDLTIDLTELMKLSVSDRVQAAATDSSFVQALMESLTPIQMAKAFPDYYRKELPDISNFILANRYLDKVSAGRFDQRGGGNYGTQQNMYGGGDATLDQTVPRLPGQQSEVEKSKVQQILDKAGITGTATGKTGVTSAIKDEKGYIISTADTSLSPAQRALLDTIAVGDPTKDKNYWESPTYNTKVFGGEFESFADHPRQARIKGSNAAGRYQFLESTWDDVVNRYNKKNPNNPITDFSPINQDRAALFLAEERYRNNTGRDLNADLANPPENMGELIKVGLGRGPVNLTWEIFTQKTAEEAGNAFDANLARNQGYREQEIEAEAKKKEGIDKQITATPELIEQFKGDETVQKYFVENPEMANKVQEAINAGRVSVDDISTIVQKKKIDSAITASIDGVISSPNFIDQGGGVRNLPIPQDIKEKMIYAQERSGIAKVVSVSSGQIPWEEAEAMGAVIDSDKNWVLPDGRIVGKGAKHRHGTDVGAGDLQFYDQEGNILSIYDPRVLDYMKYAAAAGLTGIGAGEGYMGQNTVHIGAGETGSWGGEDAIIDQQIAAGIALGSGDHLSWREQKIAAQKETTVAETAVADTSTTSRLFIGDSIAQGMRDVAKGEGTTQVGRKPHEVLSDMEKLGADHFKGKEVILSTGLSNNTQDLESVRKQMEFLKQSGAKVKIAGMSNSREDLAPGNQQLQGLASEYGYDFMGGYDAGKDKVHPTDYSAYLASANPVKEEIPKYQFGGTPSLQDDEDLTAVGPDGKPRFKFNSGEGLYVKPEANEYADDKIKELSDRIDTMSQNQQQVKKPEMITSNQSDPSWANKVASAYRPSGSQQRAFNRAQFRSEGRHVGDRGSPNIA